MQKPMKIGVGFLIILGLVLLLLSGTYYIYSYFAKSDLDGLNFERERPAFSVSTTEGYGQAISLAQSSDNTAVFRTRLTDQEDIRVQIKDDLSKNNNEKRLDPIVGNSNGKTDLSDRVYTHINSVDLVESSRTSSEGKVLDRDTDSSDESRLMPKSMVGFSPKSDESLDHVDVVPRDHVSGIAMLNKDGTKTLNAKGSELSTSRGDVKDTNSEAVDSEELLASGGPYSIAGKEESIQLLRVELPFQKGFEVPTIYNLPASPLPATRMVVPAIGVDSKVSELKLDVSGSNYAWSTPKMVIGHVPNTSRPGEYGEGWYFGHLESLIKGEGNVFKRLPEIPTLLQSGETVQILLEAPKGKYLYEVYKTKWVHRDNLEVTDSGENDITLVTCYPTLVYDHRLLVTAALVGVGDS